MKQLIIFVCFVFASVSGIAQSKTENDLRQRTYLLSHTIFGTKDSLALQDLFAKKSSYGHSGGKIETRVEAIAAICKNKSVYTDTTVSGMSIIFEKEVAIVRHLFKAKENKADGTVTPLNLSLILVWVKEKGKWKLMGRQAVKLAS